MSEKPVPAHRTELWMLVDLEPGYEAFEIGDRITPTTEWITADDIPGGVPESLLTRVAGEVEPDADPRRYGWLHLGRRFWASLRTWPAGPGPMLAEGLLFYDRYLSFDGPTREGEAVVLDRATLVRPVTWQPTSHPVMFIPEYHGRNILHREPTEPEGMIVEWICVRIGIDPLE